MINCEICGKKTHERSGNILDDGRFVCVFCEQDLDPITEMLEGKTLEQLNELEKKTNDSIEDIKVRLKDIDDELFETMYQLEEAFAEFDDYPPDLEKEREDLWSEFHAKVKEKLQASDLISEIHEKKRRLFYKKEVS